MKYTGNVSPAARKAATPEAVACRPPCLLACAKMPAEIAAGAEAQQAWMDKPEIQEALKRASNHCEDVQTTTYKLVKKL